MLLAVISLILPMPVSKGAFKMIPKRGVRRRRSSRPIQAPFRRTYPCGQFMVVNDRVVKSEEEKKKNWPPDRCVDQDCVRP